tara:strand:+ start:22921 stop:23628 length:708 start_codon:yes stop_codon:yes gene_type:complete
MDPETRGASILKGEFSGFGQLSYQSDHKLTMSEVYDFGVFGEQVNTGQALSRTMNLGLQAGLGLFPMVDIQLRENGDSPAMLLAKLQLFGAHALEAKEGFKLAMWAGAGSMEEDEGSLTVTRGNGNTRSYNGQIEVTPYEFGASAGYRFSDKTMLYLNATMARYPSKSTLTSSSNPTVVVKGDADLSAVALGFKLGEAKGVSAHFEIGASRVKWGDDIKIEQDIGTGGVAISVGI